MVSGSSPKKSKTARANPAKKSKSHAPRPDPDESALKAFCQSVELTDISFESWEHCLAHLDLRVPIWLPPADAQSGGERQVNFCRTSRDSEGAPARKAPVSVLVQIPANARQGQELRIKGQGDVVADAHGDLIVLVHVKS